MVHVGLGSPGEVEGGRVNSGEVVHLRVGSGCWVDGDLSLETCDIYIPDTALGGLVSGRVMPSKHASQPFARATLS